MRLIWMRHVTEYTPSKTGEYPSDITLFSNLRRVQKILEWQLTN